MLSDSTMAQQEDGWPLGLRLMNTRVGLAGNHDLSASVSFNTLRTHSPSSFTDSSSDLDTESTGSFYHDKSITLGSLIGVSSLLELSRRSTKGNGVEILKDKKKYKSKPWLFSLSLCIKLRPDAVSLSSSPSLEHSLEAERRAHNPTMYGPNDYSPVRPVSGTNSLFSSDQVAPVQPFAPAITEESRRSIGELAEDGYCQGIPPLFSCLYCQLIK
ncbi:uncharacterized protein At3g17950-like [Cucurbita pepo subsp. pepo]|uniref:uncharacterized protein At3g17950-like n=1 Tax=Cucurbita pepo subsp. pepo TaxID=3664 RepID=UPI000C9D356C|nr:uncharacterized protein At3g17950-like [Cucurbita pepo subsp. pepo]XP_023527604.1 uncharacterized protein At3g17950-like [Cucurbita pepo subsp. pepo]XP_023527605.1 uncharacterized protein At3g17950-like [Cucurbita pepo subsp. pepo]XP_023527606.1 uncharacterized protein At3g17950-like [Cucurbita pepo subsp. pepo]